MRVTSFAVTVTLQTIFACSVFGPVGVASDFSLANKNVRLIVGAAPGGGTDHAARLVAHFIGRYLPGEPVVLVQNMPGAGGITALNNLATRVAPDGLSFLVGSSSALTPDTIRHNPAVAYDPTRLGFVGGIAAASTLLVARQDWEARLHAGFPLVVAQVGGMRTGAQMALWGAALRGWRIQWVSGYPGSAELVNALLRGEADMTDTAGLAGLQLLMLEGRFAAIAQTGISSKGRLIPRRAFPEVPLFSDLLADRLDPAAASAFASWLRTTEIGKFFVLPPAIPPSILATYREAFAATIADPFFQDIAAVELDQDYAVTGPAELERLVGELAATKEADIAFLLDLRRKFQVPGTPKR